MRRVFYSDVSAAARVLLRHPAPDRPVTLAKLITQADAADRYVRRLGKLHPRWGNGTLAATALQMEPAQEPSFDNADYCGCFEMVLRALRGRRKCRVV